MKFHSIAVFLGLLFTNVALAQNPVKYVAEQTDNSAASYNLKNSQGFWHLSGPRSHEGSNKLSLFWNNGTYNRLFTILDNGRTGIGTDNPLSTLEVRGSIRTSISNDRYLVAFTSGDGNAYFNYSGGDAASRIGFQVNGHNSMSIMNNGFIGVGTSSPKNLFQIGDGYSFHDGGHKVLGLGYAAGGGGTSLLDGYVSEIRFDPTNGRLRFGVSSQAYSKNQTALAVPPTTMTIHHNGSVGIGTLSPDPLFKLSVNGSIRAKEIKVNTGWSDFVFEDHYRLPTLQEVEAHIQEKGHLKDIPSAEEVAEKGINLGEMDARLLQKIEELTLYMIEQNAKTDRLLEKVKELELENKTLNEKIKNLAAQ